MFEWGKHAPRYLYIRLFFFSFSFLCLLALLSIIFSLTFLVFFVLYFPFHPLYVYFFLFSFSPNILMISSPTPFSFPSFPFLSTASFLHLTSTTPAPNRLDPQLHTRHRARTFWLLRPVWRQSKACETKLHYLLVLSNTEEHVHIGKVLLLLGG